MVLGTWIEILVLGLTQVEEFDILLNFAFSRANLFPLKVFNLKVQML
jgi:hypothetical protein